MASSAKPTEVSRDLSIEHTTTSNYMVWSHMMTPQQVPFVKKRHGISSKKRESERWVCLFRSRNYLSFNVKWFLLTTYWIAWACAECPVWINADLNKLGLETEAEAVDSRRKRRKRDDGEEAINLVWGRTDGGGRWDLCVCVCVCVGSFF